MCMTFVYISVSCDNNSDPAAKSVYTYNTIDNIYNKSSKDANIHH